MGYSGYVQKICGNGHYTETDAYDDYSFGYDDDFNPICSKLIDGQKCKAKFVWSNSVDTTNAGYEGHETDNRIDIERYRKTDKVLKVCDHCNHAELTSDATYSVPQGTDCNDAELINSETYDVPQGMGHNFGLNNSFEENYEEDNIG